MLGAPQRRRFISPAMLLAVLLCFFLPFFSVSCSAGVAQVKVTVTGMDQVFGGEPEYTGFRPPPTAGGTTAVEEENSGISPSALIGFATIVVGVGLGAGLPRPGARWLSGAVASGIALVAVVVNQVMIHGRAQEVLDQAESSFRDQLGNNPIFGRSIPTPAFDLDDEPGFWVVTVLLGLVVAYNLWEFVGLQRGANQPTLAAGSAGAAYPPPLPPTASNAPGWPQSRPPQPQGPQPTDAWPGFQYRSPHPQGLPPVFPSGDRQPPQQQPPPMPGRSSDWPR
jgi:hypothetical protein